MICVLYYKYTTCYIALHTLIIVNLTFNHFMNPEDREMSEIELGYS